VLAPASVKACQRAYPIRRRRRRIDAPTSASRQAVEGQRRLRAPGLADEPQQRVGEADG